MVKLYHPQTHALPHKLCRIVLFRDSLGLLNSFRSEVLYKCLKSLVVFNRDCKDNRSKKTAPGYV